MTSAETPERTPADAEEPAPEPICAPCIGICQLDEYGYCMGCGRTAAQVANLPPETTGDG